MDWKMWEEREEVGPERQEILQELGLTGESLVVRAEGALLNMLQIRSAEDRRELRRDPTQEVVFDPEDDHLGEDEATY